MRFEEEFERRTEHINQVIENYLPQECGLQKEVISAMNYSVLAGGKRLRPLIIQEVYHLCHGTSEVILPFMAAIEMIHTYSLVHDDLPAMDNDDYRRGKLTTHKKFGESIAILAGDGLLNYAYETMLQAFSYCDTPVKDILSACTVLTRGAGIYGMVGGQTLDVLLTGKPMNEEQLDFIFQNKTGALLEASFTIGGILAGASEKVIRTLFEAGRKVGIAFQIQDDILDMTGTMEVLGKPALSDEKNNKTTYVSLYGMEKAKEDVDTFSKEAISILNDIGENEFLNALILYLIHREK